MFTPHNMSHVMCYMSCVTCHMSHVTCHMSCVTCHNVFLCFFVFLDNMVKLIGRGCVINGAYLVQFVLYIVNTLDYAVCITRPSHCCLCLLYSKIRLYPYKDETGDIQSNITLCMKEFPRAKPKGTPDGKGLYLTVNPESTPNMDIISF